MRYLETEPKKATQPPKPGGLPHCTGPDDFSYIYEPAEWWTSGFFSGSIWLPYKRSLKFTFPVAAEASWKSH